MKRSAKEEKINGTEPFAIRKNTEIKNKNMHGNITGFFYLQNLKIN